MNQIKKQQSPSKINMLAPIALVLIGYGYMFHRPQQTRLQSVQRRLEALSASQQEVERGLMDTMIASSKAMKQSREIDAELVALQAVESDLLRRRDNMRLQLTQASLPAATMQGVTHLLELHQLQVLESGPDTGASEWAEKTLRPVIDLLTEGTNDNGARRDSLTDGREVYKVRLRGRFQNLRDALESLARQQENVLPLSLQMEPMELESKTVRQNDRVWTLVILV
ncbi:hypothetical protein [Roseiconus lacunae]|uniref:hypothetical protein n=1 Tax=Roseiconus lacunae TaxID=2605694 RepID=UPI001E5E99F9|nr:hypothetical protein [Roseiconus lacunae]MCD0462440.1 hypothetical protein [Roseiconus lacunae]